MFKDFVLKVVRRKPKVRKVLSYIYLGFLKIRFFKREKLKNIIYVNPQNINFSSRYFNIYNSSGKIVNSDWDLKTKNFEECLTYKGLKEHFIGGKNWKDTLYYNNNLKEINKGKVLWHCHDKNDLLKRCRYIDNLYKNIKEKGFLLNTQIDSNHHKKEYDFVTINIGRNGTIFFNDGAHRLTIAKILKIDKIPVKVIVRHKIWNSYIKKIKTYISGSFSYQNLNHPDLNSNFKIIHKCEDRWKLMEKEILKLGNIKNKKALDIGSNMGYFSQKLEIVGFETYSLEHEINLIQILKETKKIRKYKYKIIEKDMFEWKNKNKTKFEIVLALSVFHHYLKDKFLYEKLKIFLNNLNTKILILETHNIKEKQMRNSYKNFTSKEFVNFIKIEGNFKKIKKLGVIGERTLFILKK